MDKSAIEKIVNLGAPNIIKESEYTYTDKALSVIKIPRVETVNFNTIKGLVDTLKAEYKKFLQTIIVSAETHKSIQVLTAICPNDRTRENPYRAVGKTPRIEFDRYIRSEDMIIALKSNFVQTPELLELVQLLGTIVEENGLTTLDDGFSQSVVVKKGIALKDNAFINPRIKLTPFRTFVDIEQPASEFLLRLQEGGGVALFEADGGAWELIARTNIANRLREDLAELIETGVCIVVE